MKLVRAFRDMRFRNKILFSLMFSALISILICSVLFGNMMIRDTREKTETVADQTVSEMNHSMDLYFHSMDHLIDYVIQETNLALSNIDREAKNGGSAEDTREYLQENILRLVQTHSDIAGIIIAFKDDSYVSAGISRISRDSFTREDWYQSTVSKNGVLNAIGDASGRNIVADTDYGTDQIFSLAKSFAFGSNDSRKGVVLVDIRNFAIEQMVEQTAIGEGGFVYLTDADGTVIYAPVNDVVYRIDNRLLKGKSGKSYISVKGQNYTAVYALDNYTKWCCVAVIPASQYTSGLRDVYLILAVVILIGVLVNLVVSVFFANSVNRPIKSLTELMDQVEKGNFSVRFSEDYHDEIGELGGQFNHMLNQMQDLIDRLAAERQSKVEAQMKRMQEEIKPHFLYNTLDTISWMARSHGADDVVKLVDALTNMFRLGLSQGRDYISLREECNHVTNYLYIQGFRYGDRMDYSVNIPDQYADITVPKLILQPLVENAIYHGIKMKRGRCRVDITAEQTAGYLYIHVHDTGAGMTREQTEELNRKLAEPNTEKQDLGFGMRYIVERLRIYFGEKAGLSVESVQNEYTTVTITIPYEKPERRKAGGNEDV